jgi:S-methylmethionine-dependent homocysteine/selenocysteine methylase
VARAAADAGLPVVISFTVGDRRPPAERQELGEAIAQVDGATGRAPAYYMVNCAHPTHFEQVLDSADGWRERIGGLRATLRQSHAELRRCDRARRG